MFFVKRQSKTLWWITPATNNTKRLVRGASRPSLVNTVKHLPSWWTKGDKSYFKAIGCDVRKALIVWFALRHPRLRLGRIDNRVCDLLNRNYHITNALGYGFATLK